MEYKGYQVASSNDVDKITGDLIEVVTGGDREEKKMHRQAIKALSVLAFVGEHAPAQIQAAKEAAVVLEVIDKQIETLVKDGKQFKVANGLV